MKKLVVRLDLHDDRAKQKALKTVSSLQGIDSISMDMKEKTLTVIGSVDPVDVVSKLRKYWHTDIITVGPAKEPEKKEEPKKEEAKKEEPKEEPPKEEPKKDEENQKPKEEPKKEEKKEGEEKKEKEEPAKKEVEPKKLPQQLLHPYWHMPPHDPVMELARASRAYNPHIPTHYYAQSMEENPNACIIF